MSWITTLLQFLPVLMGAITQLMPLIQAIINAINHKSAALAGRAMAESDWWLYVPGQALAGTAGMAALLCLQPRANAMAKAWHAAEAAKTSAMNQILNSREQAAKAFQLRAELMSLAPEHRKIVIGD